MLKKIIKRLVEVLTKSHFTHLVEAAYKEKDSNQHRCIQLMAKEWYGLKKVKGPFREIWCDWSMDFISQVQLELFKRGANFDLPPSEIGFQDLKINCSSKDSNSSNVYLHGFSDNLGYFHLYKKYIRTGTIALDVGANLGIHTIVMSRCVGDKGKVFSFEALIPIYERHIINLKLNSISNVRAYNLAVGECKGEVKFNDNFSDFNIGKGHIDDSGNVTVKLVALDDIFLKETNQISLIKFDIEGNELKALKGSQKLLKKHKPVIVCEFNSNQYNKETFLQLIPYKCRIYKIPLSHYEELIPLTGNIDFICDIAIVPE